MTDTNHIEVLRSALVRIAMGESDAQKIADDAIATTRALSARASAGEGGEWVMVPRKVTHAMLVAYWSYGSDEPLDESLLTDGDLGVFQGEWNDILAAAPQPQPPINSAETYSNPIGAPAHGDGEGVDAALDAYRKAWERSAGRLFGGLDGLAYLAHQRGIQAVLTTRPTPEAQEARDAERYRWLRDKCNHRVSGLHIQFSSNSRDADAAIDAAMRDNNEN